LRLHGGTALAQHCRQAAQGRRPSLDKINGQAPGAA
jgi:hypothetical protein